MKRKIFIAAFLAAVSLAGFAKGGKNANVFDLKHNITDSEIVYPESFEADTHKMLEGWFMKNYTATDTRYARRGCGSQRESLRSVWHPFRQ